MNNIKRGKLAVRIAALLLAAVMITPVNVFAAASELPQTRASDYLLTYTAYVYSAGAGKMRVYFDVTGNGYVGELGCLSIQVYECSTNSSDLSDWTWKKTFTHDSTSGMLSYDDNFHASYVTYNGTIGRYYKAYVCIWGGQDGQGDTRYFWTSAKKATLFAA